VTTALDGSVHKNITSGSSTTVTLTTSISDGLIVASILVNGTSVSSISSANTTGWALRKRQASGGSNAIEEWTGKAANALSSEVITINYAAAISYSTIDVFGVSGAGTATIFDSNAALPDFGTTTQRAITTSNANDFLLGQYRFGFTSTPTQGSGWTKISGADYLLTEYQVVAATQSALGVTIGTGDTDQNAGIADAFIAASGGATRPVKMAGDWGGYAGAGGGFAG
jgi:hypothetical protein